MTIEVALDPEYPFILHWRHIGAWRWSEFEAALKQTDVLMDAAAEPLYTVTDFTHSGLMPADLVVSLRRYLTPQSAHRNSARLIVVVGVDIWIERLWRILNTLYIRHLAAVYAGTVEEGRRLIVEERQRRIHNSFAD